MQLAIYTCNNVDKMAQTNVHMMRKQSARKNNHMKKDPDFRKYSFS